MECQCACHNKPLQVDYDAIEQDMAENGFRESLRGPATVVPRNWPENKPVPQSVKEWLRRGLADGTLVLEGGMDPRFEL